MSERVVVTLHLPLEMGVVGRILKAIAREFPDARFGENGQVVADDDLRLTPIRRRAIAKARELANLPKCSTCGKPIAWNQLEERPGGQVHRVCPRDIRRRVSAGKEAQS
jgi:hypothetical protein